MLNFKKINKIIFSGLGLLLIPLATINAAGWTDGLTAAAGFGLPGASIYAIILSFLEWILAIFTILAVLSFVITGIMFFVAGANTATAEQAKKMVGYSILGIVISLSGYIIIRLINEALLGSISVF